MSQFHATVRNIAWYRDNVPCRTACPVNTDSGRYVQLIAEGKFEEAYLVARSPNPFASVCARICAAPCEDACRRGKIDSPVTIRPLKRFVCEQYGPESSNPDTHLNLLEDSEDLGAHRLWHLPTLSKEEPSTAGQKVAVIGSGPAGLSCAHDLVLRGFKVTIFEARDETGGMMRHGIPEYRLPRGVIDREVAAIQFLGAELELNRPLDEDNNLQNLRKMGFEAVFLSVGAGTGANLNVPGVDKDGVIKAVDYLLNVNKGYKINLGEKVLVIGGGSVALDAARTAVREFYSPMEEIDAAAKAGEMHVAIDVARHAKRGGAKEIHVASLESFAEMPAAQTVQGREELETAVEEGVTLHPSWGPKEIIGNGTVNKIVMKECTRVFDEKGRFRPEFNEDNTMELDVDSIILAIGQKADLSFITEKDGIEVTPFGTIKIDPGTLATTAPGIYAGGDAAFGPRILIEAVANGKKAAQSIADYLTSRGQEKSMSMTVQLIPITEYRMPEAYEIQHRVHPITIPLDRRTGINEVEEVYSTDEAILQAERCLICHVETIYDSELCILCGRCVDVCPEDCLRLVPFDQVEIDMTDEVMENLNLNSSEILSVMLKDHDRCIRCGLCALRCPTEAMTMERLTFDESITQANS